MARRFPFNAASHLDTGALPNPLTFSVCSFWLRLNGHRVNEQTFAGNYTGPTGQLIRLSDTQPGKVGSFWIDAAASGHEAFSNVAITDGAWHHVCCLYSSAQVATVYLDGVAGTPVGPFSLKTPATPWRLGLRVPGTVPADADMAEFAMWIQGQLSAAQIAALAKGAPLLWMLENGDIRQPWCYYPLLGSFDGGINYAKGTGGMPALATSGTVATANHPPVTRLCPMY